MTAPVHKDDGRKGLIAKVHVAKKQLAMADDAYRDVLLRITGHDSSGDCSIGELEELLREFGRLGWRARKAPPANAGPEADAGLRRRGRPLADSEPALKLRALWLSAYALGVVDDPREEALSAFVKRVSGGKQRGVDALQWLTAADARKAIEGLKSWMARAGNVEWAGYSNPREAVARAQFHLVAASAQPVTLDTLAVTYTGRDLSRFEGRHWDMLIRRLGEKVRALKAKAARQ